MNQFLADSRGVLQCSAFLDWQWLDHGFSPRHSAGWLAGRQLASLKQIHSGLVLQAEAPGVQGQADALVTGTPGLHIAVRTADCFPILLIDPVHRAVAAVHSGWRGTVARVAVTAAEKMAAGFGSRPSDLHAAVGPGIGACCFEVGPEVAGHFGKEGRVRVDLADEIARQLSDAGVPATQIHLSGHCTLCRAEDYWSYRREGEAAGRMWSGAVVRER